MFKSQMRLMFKSNQFLFALTAMVVFVTFGFILNCISYFGSDIVAVPTANYFIIFYPSGSDMFFYVFSFTFPLFAALGFSDSFFTERKSHITDICLLRRSANAYYFSKLAAVFISGLLILLIPLLMNFIMCLIASSRFLTVAGLNYSALNLLAYKDEAKAVMFQSLFVNHPYLRSLLSLALVSFTGGLVAAVTYQFSFFYSRSRIILLCSFFAVYNFLSLILENFGYREYALGKNIFFYNFKVGGNEVTLTALMLIMILTVIVTIPFAKRKMNELI